LKWNKKLAKASIHIGIYGTHAHMILQVNRFVQVKSISDAFLNSLEYALSVVCRKYNGSQDNTSSAAGSELTTGSGGEIINR
jgi:hypothetical protein